ncbi:TetR/AcrR family transcriptional regulator [Mycobacterium sp. NPDC051198]
MTRTETAAATRRALLDEAAALLDVGGPPAVTLREVGARAGVSRGAPYGHFADKETLLTAVAAEGWEFIGDEMQALHHDSGLSPAETLRAALLVVVTLSRRRPYLYQLMFSPGLSDPDVIARAAQRMCDQFLVIVAAAVGEEDANRHAAVLLTAAHGASGLETSGLLHTDKWHTTADELIDNLLATIPGLDRNQ